VIRVMFSDKQIFDLRCEFLKEVFKYDSVDKIEAWAKCPHPLINWSSMAWKSFLERKVSERVIKLSDIDVLYGNKVNTRYLRIDD